MGSMILRRSKRSVLLLINMTLISYIIYKSTMHTSHQHDQVKESNKVKESEEKKENLHSRIKPTKPDPFVEGLLRLEKEEEGLRNLINNLPMTKDEKDVVLDEIHTILNTKH